MDDELVLNLATDDFISPGQGTVKKGAKRVAKRKSRSEEKVSSQNVREEIIPRSRKRPRTEEEPSAPVSTQNRPARPTQIISSLFSYNPKIEVPTEPLDPKPTKGLPILVSTPGRLLDHLQNTSSFNVGKCRWLVLDEADRLMDLGFEETIQGIVSGLEGRRKLAITAVTEGKSMEVGGWDWERRRKTVLCSATIEESVQKLAGTTLVNPLMVKATEVVEKPLVNNTTSKPSDEKSVQTPITSEKFTPPSQLAQKYVVVPLKLRLVALVALLRSLITQSLGRRSSKIIVFLSCTDSVDFHWNLLGGSTMDGDSNAEEETEDKSDSEDEKNEDSATRGEKVEVRNSLLPDTSIFRLHGSLSTSTRLASIRGFSGNGSSRAKQSDTTSSSILLCTSVASRGLDLPLVRAVVQYDLPTEGGATEYVHRVGRTARAGKGGEAWSFVSPSETEWVTWVEEIMRGDKNDNTGDEKRNVSLTAVGIDSVLKSGFGGKGTTFEERATDVQLAFERWVLQKKENAGFARKAYLSHIRAYATHPANEKHIFHVRHLHLGHLAKSFGLREAPKAVTNKQGPSTQSWKTKDVPQRERKSREKGEKWEIDRSGEAEKRMQAVVRAQGRLTKKGGALVSSDASEFQISGGYDLEKLVHG
ncbi:hypothetical protein C0993_011177 [Termitomyces sp. T159_Od127]|nr:hypothetical protein C0993_011177 [Termitomyces sp. T159_Od127]